MKIEKWIERNCTTLQEKIIVITGTTGGLGYETLMHLAKLKANLVIGVRRTEFAKKQCEKIQNLTSCAEIKILYLDISNSQSIREFSEKLDKLYPAGIDVLVCNAGTYSSLNKPMICGLQSHFFTNCIGTLFLSKLVLPLLNKKENSKLVVVSSLSYSFVKVNKDDIDGKKIKSKLKSYSNTKLWLTIGAENLKTQAELSYKNVCINICHPGICATSIIKPSGKIKRFFYKFVDIAQKIVFPSTKKQALNEVYAVYARTISGEWIGPAGKTKVYGKPKIQPLKIKNEDTETKEFVCRKIDEIIENL